MRSAQVRNTNTQDLGDDIRMSVEKTQRYLRHTVRKVLTTQCNADIAEQALYIEDPHVYATWTSHSILTGAGIKVGVRIQFDSQDGKLLQQLRGHHSAEELQEAQILRSMQNSMNTVTSELQHHCQDVGLITGISQASINKAFEPTQGQTPFLKGGVIDSWLLRIDDCALYCVTQLVLDQNRDIVLLSQGLH